MTQNANDVVAIQRVSAQYANAMDDGDVAAWLDTWDAAGVWEGGIGRYEGKQNLAKLLPDLGERVKGKRHAMTNFVVTVNGDEATQTCYLLIVDRSKQSPVGTAVYRDILRRINGHWRFVHRKVQLD